MRERIEEMSAKHDQKISVLSNEITLLRNQLGECHDEDLEKLKRDDRSVAFMKDAILDFLKQT